MTEGQILWTDPAHSSHQLYVEGGVIKERFIVSFEAPANDPRWTGCWVEVWINYWGTVKLHTRSIQRKPREIVLNPAPSGTFEAEVRFLSMTDPGTTDPTDDGVNTYVPGFTPMFKLNVGVGLAGLSGTLDLTHATAGTLTVAAFGSEIRPVEKVASLPTSFTDFPQGAIVILTTDNKLYRSTGSAWTKVVDPNDIPDRTIAGAKMVALSITSVELAADAATFGKVAAAAVGTRELVASEILLGQGGGKPSRFKAVDTVGAATCFIGADTNGFFNWFRDIRIGPDINNPTIYGSATGVTIDGATFAITGTGNNPDFEISDGTFTISGGIFGYTIDMSDGHIRISASPDEYLDLYPNQTYVRDYFGQYASLMALELAFSSPLAHVTIDGNQVVGARKTGWSAATGTTSRATFDTATVTTAQLAQRVKTLIDDLITHGLIGA